MKEFTGWRGCKIGCKLGKSRLHNLQKLCYSFRLGSCRKVRVNPDVSIAARVRPEGVVRQGSEFALKTKVLKRNEADLTSDKNFFIISFLCCNDSDDAKAKLAEVDGQIAARSKRSTEFSSTAL